MKLDVTFGDESVKTATRCRQRWRESIACGLLLSYENCALIACAHPAILATAATT